MENNSPLFSSWATEGSMSREEAKLKARHGDWQAIREYQRERENSTFRSSVYGLFTQPGLKPLKLGRHKNGTLIEVPDWLKDDVMPSRMPNGMAYTEMRSLVSYHKDEAAEFNSHLSDSDKPLELDENLAIWLYKHAAEQDLLMTWFREFLSEVWVNFEMAAEVYSDEEYKKHAWLFEKVVDLKCYYGMDYGQLIKVIDDYFGHMETAIQCCFDNDPFPACAMIMYQMWLQGEDLLGTFEYILKDIVENCVDLIERRKKEGDANGNRSEE